MASRQAVAELPRRAHRPAAAINGLSVLGALLLAAEAAVHVQQFVVIFHLVRWVGPLFVANAAACAAAISGLAYKPTRTVAGLAGVLISTAALGGLALSYTVGLFGWIETGLRTPVVIALGSEVSAVIVLAAATWSRWAEAR